MVLVNLADEAEYCEKLMYVQRGMATPAHTHAKKKEDIICRWGELQITMWRGKPNMSLSGPFSISVNGVSRSAEHGEVLHLSAGERVTLVPGIYHEFVSLSEECIIGEVSTANDDANDNFFINPEVGRFSEIEEDAPATVRLLHEK